MNYYETREFWNEIDLKPNNESDWEVIVKNDTITFSKNFDLYIKEQPKQVEINDSNIDIFINKYINDLPKNWTSNLDMYLAMKNSIIEALSYPDKYTIKRNI